MVKFDILKKLKAKKPRYESMSAEKRLELKQRKIRLSKFKLWHKEALNNPTETKPKVNVNPQWLKDISHKIFHMDEPQEEWGVNLWHKENEPISKQPENTFNPALNSLIEQSNEHNQAEQEVDRISNLPKDKLQKWLDEPESE